MHLKFFQRVMTFAAMSLGAHFFCAEAIAQRPDSTRDSAAVRDTARKSTSLPAVTVIGTRTDLDETRQAMHKIPGAVSLVTSYEMKQTRQANLKDILAFTPGVFVQSRFGAADESQISIRGSGLRDNFHARGVNLLVNGMPYRNADGFTDFESLEMLTADAVEVYKGANALRYGGSTLGGAINIDTKTGYSMMGVAPYVEGGSFGFYKAQLEAGNAIGPFDYYASYAKTGLDGYRDWSDNHRDRINLHAGYRFSDHTDARAFFFFARVGEHLPGSLTRAQFDSAPTAADPVNVSGRWGRTYNLHHLGVQLRTVLSAHQRLEISPYLQVRSIDHPIFQVIAQQSHDLGSELRYTNDAAIGGKDNKLIFGTQTAQENLDNRQYVNQAGAHGGLTKNQSDRATLLSFYGEDLFSLTSLWTASVGARWENSTRGSRDHFLSDGDQSDERRYNPFTPKVGIVYALPDRTGQLFANVSRSFEPPLLLELNSLTVPGFIRLDGQDATQYEIGGRRSGWGLSWELSLYNSEITNEIINLNVKPFPSAQFTVPTYRNSPRTRHSGIEAGAQYRVPGHIFTESGGGDRLSFRGAYTLGIFKFVKDSNFSGNDIPGAPRHHVSAEMTYVHPSGISVTPSLEWVPQAYFLDAANDVTNDSWHSIALRVEWASQFSGSTVFASVQNLQNARYSASAQVENAAGKYYEPADGRTFYIGGRWAR